MSECVLPHTEKNDVSSRTHRMNHIKSLQLNEFLFLQNFHQNLLSSKSSHPLLELRKFVAIPKSPNRKEPWKIRRKNNVCLASKLPWTQFGGGIFKHNLNNKHYFLGMFLLCILRSRFRKKNTTVDSNERTKVIYVPETSRIKISPRDHC